MNKILLLILSITSIGASAQVMIQHDGAGANLAGTTVNIAISASDLIPSSEGSYFEYHMTVTNNFPDDRQWRVTRYRQSVPGSWDDKLCWPPLCVATSGVYFTTENTPVNPAPTVLQGTSTADVDGLTSLAELKPQIFPDLSNASSATYKYYLETVDGTRVDSVTLQFDYVLGVSEKSNIATISIAPNPATDYVDITLEGTESAQVRIVDVLGNIVYSKKINGTTKVNTADFNSGVYFVNIINENKKAITKKLIVRH